MASSITRFDIEKLDGNIEQNHRGSKQVGLKQLGSKQVGFKQLGHKQQGCKQLGTFFKTGVHGVQDEKRVWFEVELQGAQRNRETKYFWVSNDDVVVAQRRLEDKQLEERTNTDCLVKKQEKIIDFSTNTIRTTLDDVVAFDINFNTIFNTSYIIDSRLHEIHRRSAGTNAMVVLGDTRWEDSRQIIGTMKVDLSTGTQLVYMFPDMVLSIDDFHNHVEVVIQTHKYDTWQGAWTTLWITSQQLASAIPGERRSVEELEGMSWNLKPSEQTTICVPSRVTVYERLNRSLRLQFERYHRTPPTSKNKQDFLDEYLPQWDDQLAIQKQKLEMEWNGKTHSQQSMVRTIQCFIFLKMKKR
nr:zinc finger, CCHC-type [Tanacetum cinerariifolium]